MRMAKDTETTKQQSLDYFDSMSAESDQSRIFLRVSFQIDLLDLKPGGVMIKS